MTRPPLSAFCLQLIDSPRWVNNTDATFIITTVSTGSSAAALGQRVAYGVEQQLQPPLTSTTAPTLVVQFIPPSTPDVSSDPRFAPAAHGCAISVTAHDVCDVTSVEACRAVARRAPSGTNFLSYQRVQSRVTVDAVADVEVISSPNQAVDGSNATFWVLSSAKEVITVDVTALVVLDYVSMVWAQPTDRAWLVQVSYTQADDAFHTIASGAGAEAVTLLPLTGVALDVSLLNLPGLGRCAMPWLSPVRARFVRVVFEPLTATSVTGPGSLAEVGAFGCDPNGVRSPAPTSPTPFPRDYGFSYNVSQPACNTTTDNITYSIVIITNQTCPVNQSRTVVTTHSVTYPTFSLSLAETAVVTGIDPVVGSSQGGDVVFVYGSGFVGLDYSPATATVLLGGAPCVVDPALSNTNILTCTSSPQPSSTHNLPVTVTFHGYQAITGQDGVWFSVVDRWSSHETWGGYGLPKEHEPVVVPAGKTLLLDVSPPALGSLLVLGRLVFEDKQDLTLTVGNLTIDGGGALQVGTELAPFAHSATIQLLPYAGYTSKVVAPAMSVVRGSLDLHGTSRVSWVPLAVAAAAGAQVLTLAVAVDWPVGGTIVIAGSNLGSDSTDETAVITGVTNGGLAVALAAPLSFSHLAGPKTLGTTTTDASAVTTHVGLLTRNVVVAGSSELYAYEHRSGGAFDDEALAGLLETVSPSTVGASFQYEVCTNCATKYR